MKRPQPDLGTRQLEEFISTIGGIRKLRRLWGLEPAQVGGFDVLLQRQYYYRPYLRSANFEKLFRYLGAYEDLADADMDGIKSAWLYFNKNKAPPVEDLNNVYENYVRDNLNLMWWDTNDGVMPVGITLTTSIVIERLTSNRPGKQNPNYTNILDPDPQVMDTAALITAVTNNYDTLWTTCHIEQYGVGTLKVGTITDPIYDTEIDDIQELSSDDPWMAAMARYALRTNGVSATVTDVTRGLGKVINGQLHYTFIVTLEIPYVSVNNNTPMVEDIAADLKAGYYQRNRDRTRFSFNNGYWTQQAIRALEDTDTDPDPNISINPDVIYRPYTYWEAALLDTNATYDALWVQVGKKYYLKSEPFTNPGLYSLKFRDLSDYVIPLIDSRYKKKDVSWFKKFIAVVVFVVAAILAPVTGGGSVKLALQILFAAFVMTIAQLALSKISASWAQAFAEVNKALQPIVVIAQIYYIVTATYTAYKAAEAALEEAAEEAVKQGLAEVATEVTFGDVLVEMLFSRAEGFIDSIIKDATNAFNLKFSQVSTGFWEKMGDLVNRFQMKKLERIIDRNKDLAAENEKLAEEEARNTDALQGFMDIYPRPATADWSMYAEQFDMPYERVQGTLALGNIQRTTFKATRPGNYTDTSFDGILGLRYS